MNVRKVKDKKQKRDMMWNEKESKLTNNTGVNETRCG
jgi:hypothetical protein